MTTQYKCNTPVTTTPYRCNTPAVASTTRTPACFQTADGATHTGVKITTYSGLPSTAPTITFEFLDGSPAPAGANSCDSVSLSRMLCRDGVSTMTMLPPVWALDNGQLVQVIPFVAVSCSGTHLIGHNYLSGHAVCESERLTFPNPDCVTATPVLLANLGDNQTYYASTTPCTGVPIANLGDNVTYYDWSNCPGFATVDVSNLGDNTVYKLRIKPCLN